MAAIRKNIEIGFKLPSLSKKMTLKAMFPMSGGNPIHWDEERSKQEGLKTAIATGMISTGWLSHVLMEFFGEDWVLTGHIANTYIAQVFENDIVTCKTVVKEKIPVGDATCVVMEVWCENQNGQNVTVGTASVLVH